MAYVFQGEGVFGVPDEETGETVSNPRLVVFDDGDFVEAHAIGEALRFLLVSGKPSHEPIVRYGPFVMNTREEIDQALRVLRNGTFVFGRAAAEGKVRISIDNLSPKSGIDGCRLAGLCAPVCLDYDTVILSQIPAISVNLP